MRGACLGAAALVAMLAPFASLAAAAPRLAARDEVLEPGRLKGRLLENSRFVPRPTPAGRTARRTSGGETKEYRIYDQDELWRLRALVGEWRDPKGNSVVLARVVSLPPRLDMYDCTQEAVNARLDELEKEFGGTDDELAQWRESWGPKGKGDFVVRAGRRYWAELRFAGDVKEAEAQKLLEAFKARTSVMFVGREQGANSWWTTSNDKYLFYCNLDKSRGMKFVKDFMRTMAALRGAFEFYVPPKKEAPKAVVRIFRTLAEYREYRRAAGAEDTTSCGLWDPNREELLVVAENTKDGLSTMRHEAFHQYLHYATGRGDHAQWFNEGHATLFENVKFAYGSNTLKIVDEGSRAAKVASNPEKYAALLKGVLAMSHGEFGSGAVSDHYVAAWAMCYFLEKGAYAAREFEPYRGICPKYLRLMDEGASAADATAQAWREVEGRDVAADFLKFWREKRKDARKVR